MARVVHREVVAADAMGRWIRETESFALEDIPPEQQRAHIHRFFEGPSRPNARAELQELIDNLALWLIDKGWPDPRRGCVFLNTGGWGYKRDPSLSVLKKQRVVDYIMEKAGALSQPGAYARIVEEAGLALRAYEAGNLDALFNHTHNLATLRSREASRRAFLSDVERGQKVAGAAASGGKALAQDNKVPLRLARMADLVPHFGVSSAAHILASEGLGTPEANRKLWHRKRK